jgi:DNA-binding LacI/PurR family transcriptional regulator
VPAARPPTIIDVARRAGVSKSLVSRVLRGSARVSPSRSEAVQSAMVELGYRPNAVARSLVQRRSFTVGVVVADLHNLFFAEILDGIGSVAGACGYQPLITTGQREPESETAALEKLLQLRTDGLILAGAVVPAEVVRAATRSAAVVLVSSGLRVSGVDTVGTDDVRGAGLAVEHLVGLGHRRIALIDGGAGAGAAERRRGYKLAMRQLGLDAEVRVAPGDFTEEGGYRGARRLLERGPRPSAMCCGNDLAAVGALNALEETGLQVPGDVSLVGYDNTTLAALRHVSLTTVHQPRREMGQQAMTLLLRRIQRPTARARRLLLEPSLVVRGTTTPTAQTG